MSLPLRLRTLAVALLAVRPLFRCASSHLPRRSDAQIPPGISDSLSNLADQPATHTGVVFDRSMMQMAQGMLQQGGLDADRAAAALTSISFDTYRYKEPAFYTPETMASIVEAYPPRGLEAPGQRQPDAGERGPAADGDHRRVAALYRRRHRPRDGAGARRRAT